MGEGAAGRPQTRLTPGSLQIGAPGPTGYGGQGSGDTVAAWERAVSAAVLPDHIELSAHTRRGGRPPRRLEPRVH